MIENTYIYKGVCSLYGMGCRIRFTEEEYDFLKEVLNNVMTDLIDDGDSLLLNKQQLINLADKFNLIY